MSDDTPIARPGLVASVLLLRQGKFLIVQEGKESARGQWGLPGGRVHEGETFLDAAHREMMEETGFEIHPIGLTRVMRYRSQLGVNVLRANVVAEVSGGELRLDGVEILDARWVTPEEFDQMPDTEIRTPWAARVVIDDLRNGRVFDLEIMWEALEANSGE